MGDALRCVTASSPARPSAEIWCMDALNGNCGASFAVPKSQMANSRREAAMDAPCTSALPKSIANCFLRLRGLGTDGVAAPRRGGRANQGRRLGFCNGGGWPGIRIIFAIRTTSLKASPTALERRWLPFTARTRIRRPGRPPSCELRSLLLGETASLERRLAAPADDMRSRLVWGRQRHHRAAAPR
ncbi:hypothetical protein BCR34DRAFT_297880 [Clohesyomyces aquaticus]|uniref:Uncharacterized protein n=1 Tax=Clohesyomyces aquaticus TaxID=1231657 RepID=A0A1Y1ZQJ0_9PLEO|nr:hypothetical protein BCR34DRAFT_297880 [Clohesyomyces aquaticus]